MRTFERKYALARYVFIKSFYLLWIKYLRPSLLARASQPGARWLPEGRIVNWRSGDLLRGGMEEENFLNKYSRILCKIKVK